MAIELHSKMSQTRRAFTISYATRQRVLISKASIKDATTGKIVATQGIWDTGASNSGITTSLVRELGLVPKGKRMAAGVHGQAIVNAYEVRIKLPNEVTFSLSATECSRLSVDDTARFLIGMDVIGFGDFAVTNVDGKTRMSFRVPSQKEIDYVKEESEAKRIETSEVSLERPIGRNDPCPCGSGKKYKYCHLGK